MELTKANETSKDVQNKLKEMQNPTSQGVLNYNQHPEEYKETIERLELEVSQKDKELKKLLKELKQTAERARKEKQELEAEWQIKLQAKLSEREQELNEEWSLKVSTVSDLQQQRDRLEDDKRNHQYTLEQLNISGNQALSRVLAHVLTGEDIPSDLVYTLLPKIFSSIGKFAFQPKDGYVFADVYTGFEDIFQLANNGLRMLDLLYWMKGFSVPSRIHLDANTWLEHHFSKQIRSLQKGDTWILLAHSLLSNIVLSDNWPICCIAIVRLAVLSNQHPMRDTNEWRKFVVGLMDSYKELNNDPLAQACFAYLSLTTSDPQTTMARNLPVSLSQADFDMTARIPELVARLSGSPDVALANDNGTLSVAIVRHSRYQDVVFSRIQNSTNRSFSLQPLQA